MTQDSIEINNAKQEIQEIVEKCNYCGLCKELDPVFKVLREEAQSSRGRAILFSKNIFDKNIFADPLSGQCKISCPFDIDLDLAIRKARKVLNLKNRQHSANKKILKKIQNKQNPFEQEQED